MRWFARARQRGYANYRHPGRFRSGALLCGNYLTGKRTDPALDERIDHVYQSANGSLPDRSELKQLSDDFSVDFAALYMADQIARKPINQRFRSAFDQAYDYAREAFPEGRVKLSTDYEVLEHPDGELVKGPGN